MKWVTLLPALALAAGALACNRNDKATGSTTTTTASASATVSAAVPSAVPYLPARTVAHAAPDAPVSQVEAVIFSLRPGLNLCYRVAAKENPKLEANAIFSVTIGSDGKVLDASLEKTETLLSPDLIECIARVLKGGIFKETPDAAIATISVPINFRPPRGGVDAGH